MHSKIVSSCENENLKIYQGRVLTLLGDLDDKINKLLSFVEDEVDSDSQREQVDNESDSEWHDG